MATVLIIDRNPQDVSRHVLAGRDLGHEVELFADHEEACRSIERRRPDAIVVSRLAGDVFRNDICRELRRMLPVGQVAIIAMVPASAALTRIGCLEAGADVVTDDDVTPGHLWSRIDALVTPRIVAREGVRLAYATIEMLVDEHKVFASGVPLALNLTSFSILRTFLENPERILVRREISGALGRAGLHQERTIDVHIRTLRRAMKPAGADELIVTVPQIGYMLCDRTVCDCRNGATAGRPTGR